jgi:hypothetical protein
MELSAPIVGRTYSLYGTHQTTEEYYQRVNALLDKFLEKYSNKEELLKKLRKADKTLSYAKKHFLSQAQKELSEFLTDIDYHLSQLSFITRFLSSSALSRKPYKYLLNMIEIELTNRINKADFLRCEKKIALLPHCLRDLRKNCQSEKEEIDFVCRRCSVSCFINKATRLLNESNIKAYIWKEAGKGLLFNKKSYHAKSLGVLGIACIPELTNGMRYCSKRNIPVIGLPLDANRCIRWMDSFHENSINLTELERLLRE